MGVRVLLIASISTGLVLGSEDSYAQDEATGVHTLPPVEVSPPAEGAKRGRSQATTRIARARPRVYIPTAPTSSSTSGVEADKVPATINVVDSRQIERTGSLNITDALQQAVPGISISEVTGNPFQPNVEYRGFVAGARGLPERRPHQRSLRRHRQLGPDSDRRDPVGRCRDQQSRLWPQRAGRGDQHPDEGRLQLPRRRDQHDGRLVRPYPELGAVGQAGR